MSPRRTLVRGRLAASVNSAVVVLVALLVATFALAARPAAPPSVAEFAPQAAKQIDKAPDGLTGDVGGSGIPGQDPVVVEEQGSGGERGGSTNPNGGGGDGDGDEPEGVPSALACVSWPDGSVTQTWDPQSPPCIASWPEVELGNGGATYRGVTGTDIRVAVNSGQGRLPQATWQLFFDFFNNRYQLYGRRLVPIFYDDWFAASPEDETALARDLIAEGAFAALDYNYYYNELGGFSRTLAEAGVPYVRASRTGNFDTSADAAGTPDLLWSYYPEFDRRLRAAGSLTCAALAGRPPSFGGTGTNLSTSRSFAVLVPDPRNGAPRPDISPLTDALAGCGIEPVIAIYSQQDAHFNVNNPGPAVVTMMAGLQQDGTTTLIPVAGTVEEWMYLMRAAERAQYQPEWVATGRMRILATTFRAVAPSQIVHLFGIEESPRTLPMTQQPWNRALVEGGGRSHYDISTDREVTFGEEAYGALQLLAAGIQMAGPDLTPATFGAALRATRFPNPGSGLAPFFQPSIGFGSGVYSEVKDWGIRWWSPITEDPNDRSPGTWCWLRGGARFTESSWPTDVPFTPGTRCP